MPNSISNEGGYDSLEIETLWQQAVTPDPYLLVSEWADKYRLLSPKSAAEPGRWRTARTPYLQEIMDHLAPASPVQRIVFMKGSQVGGTECGNNWIGYVIDVAPGPMMAVAPTVTAPADRGIPSVAVTTTKQYFLGGIFLALAALPITFL